MDPKILVAIDIEHRSHAVKALKEASKLAQCIKGEIHVCYVLAYGFYDYVKPFLVEEVVKDSIAHAKMELVSFIKEADLYEDMIYRHVLKGGVYHQILLLAEKLDTDYNRRQCQPTRSDDQYCRAGDHSAGASGPLQSIDRALGNAACRFGCLL